MSRLRSTVNFLLDIDGTLVFSDSIYFRVFQHLLKPLGYDVDEPFYKDNVHGKVDADVFRKLMPGASPEELNAMSKKKDDTFCELYREEAAKHGPPMLKGLPEALAFAHQQNVRCIAVTNAPRGAAETTLESLRNAIPEASVIEGLVIGAECTRAKPHPDPYVEGARQLGVALSDCIVFEDSRSGIQSGIAAGVPVIGMRTSLSDEELRGVGCVATLADWTGLTVDMIDEVVTKAAGGITSPAAPA